MRRILIVGAGFAGMWSALGAARVLDATVPPDEPIEIALIAPEPYLHIRPRFYEAGLEDMKAPLQPLFDVVDVRYIGGTVEHIRCDANAIDAVGNDGARFTLSYDRLVLAAGSHVFRPDIPGLREHAFSVDQLDEAAALAAHLHHLADLPDSPARNTVVVAGGGFTGIETAAEMPARLRAMLGDRAAVNVIVIERADVIGPDLGSGPRPVIMQALESLGVAWRVNTAVTAIDQGAVYTSTGERIATRTVIWTAGLRASDLTQQIPAPRDPLGRLHVGDDLRVDGIANVFATGDVCLAATDSAGHHALMSCQHALTQGKFAGHNVAADLLGSPTIPYRQPRYVTCLDLGPWGAVYTEGWEREVRFSGERAKTLKQTINTKWIYPPPADRTAALAAAAPTT